MCYLCLFHNSPEISKYIQMVYYTYILYNTWYRIGFELYQNGLDIRVSKFLLIHQNNMILIYNEKLSDSTEFSHTKILFSCKTASLQHICIRSLTDYHKIIFLRGHDIYEYDPDQVVLELESLESLFTWILLNESKLKEVLNVCLFIIANVTATTAGFVDTINVATKRYLLILKWSTRNLFISFATITNRSARATCHTKFSRSCLPTHSCAFWNWFTHESSLQFQYDEVSTRGSPSCQLFWHRLFHLVIQKSYLYGRW